MSQNHTEDRIAQLEMLLFAVVRAILLPTSLRLKKTEEELTEKTFETINKTKQTIDYRRVKTLMGLGKDKVESKESKIYSCTKCANHTSPLCQVCTCIHSPGNKENKPKYFIPMQEIISPMLLYLESSNISYDVLIKEYLKYDSPVPLHLVLAYNESVTPKDNNAIIKE